MIDSEKMSLAEKNFLKMFFPIFLDFKKMKTVFYDFDQMTLLEKIDFLKEILRRQSLLAEQNLTGWFLIVFSNEINNVYAKHRDDILSELRGKRSEKDILDIIMKYF